MNVNNTRPVNMFREPEVQSKDALLMKLPASVMQDVLLPMLPPQTWASLAKTCMKSYQLVYPFINDEVKVVRALTFGRANWLKIPGVVSVSEEPQSNRAKYRAVYDYLKRDCPFFNEPDAIQPHRFQDDKIRSACLTHMVIFCPEMVNDESRTHERMGRLFRFEKEGNHETVFEFETGKELNPKYLTEPAPESYFALVTKDVVPGSRRTTQGVKVELLKPKGCRLYNSVNEAATVQLIMNLGPSQEKKGYFFGREGGQLFTYAATSMPNQNGVPLVVGAAAPSGPRVYNYYDGCDNVGAAGVSEVL